MMMQQQVLSDDVVISCQVESGPHTMHVKTKILETPLDTEDSVVLYHQ